MNRRIVLAVVGIVGMMAVLAFANPFAQDARPFWSDIVIDTRSELGLSPTATVFTQEDIMGLHPLFLTNSQAEALWDGLAELGGQARSAMQLIAINGIGDTTVARILLFFDLDMDGWTARRG